MVHRLHRQQHVAWPFVRNNLDLFSPPRDLARALVDIPSPSHQEAGIADAVEAALRALADAPVAADSDDEPGAAPHAASNANPAIEVARFGNTVCARTNRGLGSRVVLAGHIDTVPIADNVPSRIEEGPEGPVMWGCGSVDMKSGMAVYLNAFARLASSPALRHDLTVIAYEGEEVATEFNGLGHLQRDHPEWLRGDLALLGEPSGSIIEAGCQGSIRLRITAHGTRAHSARSWLGRNAAHDLAPLMQKVAQYEPREINIDGCTYREGLNIVHLESGVATNTIPDVAWMFVNFRFAPDRSVDEAMAHVLEVLGVEIGGECAPGHITVEIDDAAGAALPGLGQPAARALVDAVGGRVRAKYGWTDVARFSELGVPAVNFGPGDPGYAHKKDEQCPLAEIDKVSSALIDYLSAQAD